MKTNLKRIISLLLVLVMVFALAACGETKKPEDKKEEPAKTEDKKEEPAKAEDKKEEPAKAEDKKEEPAKAEDKKEEPAKGLTGAINVYSRDKSSGTRGAFEELVEFKGELTDKAAEVESNGDMAAKVGKDAAAIGYVSLTTDFDANNIKAVKYEGAEATEENVIGGQYTLKRPFAYVTRAEGNFPSDEVQQLVKAFLAFINESQEGIEAVKSAGGIVSAEGAKPWEEVKKDHPIVDQDNSKFQIRTGGSTSVEKTIKAASEAFAPLAGNVEVIMAHTGSGDGFKRTLGKDKDGADAIDLGFASREFKDDETVKDGMASGVYCKDAVVVAVEKANPIENLTKAQVKDIFTGKVANWEELGQ